MIGPLYFEKIFFAEESNRSGALENETDYSVYALFHESPWHDGLRIRPSPINYCREPMTREALAFLWQKKSSADSRVVYDKEEIRT